MSSDPLLTNLDYSAIPARGLKVETCRKFNYAVGKYDGTPCQVAHFYNKKGMVTGQKLRFPGKRFKVLGEVGADQLFGSQLFRGSGKMAVITTGEIDAMASYEALGSSWPCGSAPLGDGTAAACVKANLDLLSGYERVVLAYDMDASGRKALEETVPLLRPGQAFIADLGAVKDADELRRMEGNEALRKAIWDAAPWRPDGIVNLRDFRDEILRKPTMGLSYPWHQLNQMLYGMHEQELIVLTAGTGTGKSTAAAEIAYHLLETTDVKVGMIFLEEGIGETGKRLLGIALNVPIHLPGHDLPEARLNAEFDRVFGSGRIIGFNHFGSIDADNLINRIRFMFQVEGCALVILDHISIVVSGNDLSADERRVIDRAVTMSRSLIQETNGRMIMVSHLKRPQGTEKGHERGLQVNLNQLRGSGAIGQLANTIIALERDQQPDHPEDEDMVRLRILKNRTAGRLGVAGQLHYNHETGRLEEIHDVFPGDLGALEARPKRAPKRGRRAAVPDRSDY